MRNLAGIFCICGLVSAFCCGCAQPATKDRSDSSSQSSPDTAASVLDKAPAAQADTAPKLAQNPGRDAIGGRQDVLGRRRSRGTASKYKSSLPAVDDNSFRKEVLESKLPVLVDFWAPWCRPCRRIGPLVEELKDDYSGKLKVVSMNVDDNPISWQTYQIRGIPALLLFKQGMLVEQSIGLRPKSDLATMIERHI